jgi:predicted DNA-binding mobile mystery protein A
MAQSSSNAVARRHLDARLSVAAPLGKVVRPPRGWIKAIREALGMSTAQLAARMGVQQPSVVLLEHSEARKRIKLETLERAAQALNCRLVYALVPNEPLDTMVKERARAVAQRHMLAISHSMRLENQEVTDGKAVEQQLDKLVEQIDARKLWEDQ